MPEKKSHNLELRSPVRSGQKLSCRVFFFCGFVDEFPKKLSEGFCERTVYMKMTRIGSINYVFINSFIFVIVPTFCAVTNMGSAEY